MSIRTAFCEAFHGWPDRAARKTQHPACAGSFHFWRSFNAQAESSDKAVASAQIKERFIEGVTQ